MRNANFTRLSVILALSLIATAAGAATTPQPVDRTAQFVAAGVQINGLRALEVGGIVVIRGTTDSDAKAQAASVAAETLGYTRVANLIRVVDAPDDAKIERTAERQLATRVLDGCTFHLDSQQGVLTVDGHVRHELQKDVAMSILRNIDGVREVHASLQR